MKQGHFSMGEPQDQSRTAQFTDCHHQGSSPEQADPTLRKGTANDSRDGRSQDRALGAAMWQEIRRKGVSGCGFLMPTDTSSHGWT